MVSKSYCKGGKRRQGVVLYIYGGHVLEIYVNKKGLEAGIFSEEYYKHFKVENTGQEVSGETLYNKLNDYVIMSVPKIVAKQELEELNKELEKIIARI